MHRRVQIEVFESQHDSQAVKTWSKRSDIHFLSKWFQSRHYSFLLIWVGQSLEISPRLPQFVFANWKTAFCATSTMCKEDGSGIEKYWSSPPPFCLHHCSSHFPGTYFRSTVPARWWVKTARARAVTLSLIMYLFSTRGCRSIGHTITFAGHTETTTVYYNNTTWNAFLNSQKQKIS